MTNPFLVRILRTLWTQVEFEIGSTRRSETSHHRRASGASRGTA